jgi:hypothetical protein
MSDYDDLLLLRRVAELLYGPSWQTPLALALGVNLRNVQRWIAGGPRVPSAETWLKLADLVRDRREELALALDEIASGTNLTLGTRRNLDRVGGRENCDPRS